MPETETNTEATTPTVEYTAQDALKDIQEPAEEPEVTKEPEVEEESATTDEVPDEPETEEDLPLRERLKLDDNVLEALPEEARTRWDQQVAGLEKIDNKLTELAAHTVRLTNWEEALSNPDTAQDALLQLEANLKEKGIDMRSVFGKPTETTDNAPEFELESDQKLHASAVATAVKQAKTELLASLGYNPSDVKALLDERAQAQRDTEFQSYVNGLTPRVAARAIKTEGWTVTKEMVATAAKESPDLIKTDPIKALKKAFPDEYANHKASKATEKEVPTMVDGGTTRGIEIPTDPMQYTARHALQEVGT